MTTKLNCAVCGYTDINSNICPNCATDLSLIRMLQQLPQRRGDEVCNCFAQGGKQKGVVKIAAWLGVTLFILTVGIGLGVVGIGCASF